MGWGGRASKRGGGGENGGGRKRDTVTSGCMCAIFQLFDFHHIQLSNLHHQQHPLRSQDLTIPKGVEAPKHSLDSYYEGNTSFPSITKEDEPLNSHILKIQPIKTSGGNISDSSSFSPATKTPTLVARLMGLDLLPESHSPSSVSSLTPDPHYSKRSHLNPHPLRQNTKGINANGTRSLPETPRVSSSSRRSDVDHHRLSLQINKVNVGEELEFSKMKSLKRKEMLKSIIGDHESGRSPSHYARQIVKQVKENVNKRVGLIDVTNTIRNDQNLLTHQHKSKKLSSSSSCSPRLKSSEVKNINPTITTCKVDQCQSGHPKQSNPKPKIQSLQEKKRRKNVEKDGFSSSKLKKQEEAFVRPATAPARAQQQCKKKTQLISNNLINLNNFPTLLPIKKVPQKQLSSSTSQQKGRSYKIDHQGSSFFSTNVLSKNDDVLPNGFAAAGATGGVGTSSDVRQYVMRILSRSGIDKDTRVHFTNWFSPSHPLDPSIFHHLENYYVTIFTDTGDHKFHIPSQLKLKCNRKLVFHVVDEILVEILKPYLKLKPWVTSTKSVTKFGYKGSKVIDVVCEKIRKLPGADCRILEDIDALIDKDLPEPNAEIVSASAFEEEGEGLVRQIEKDIMDALVHEMVMCLRF